MHFFFGLFPTNGETTPFFIRLFLDIPHRVSGGSDGFLQLLNINLLLDKNDRPVVLAFGRDLFDGESIANGIIDVRLAYAALHTFHLYGIPKNLFQPDRSYKADRPAPMV